MSIIQGVEQGTGNAKDILVDSQGRVLMSGTSDGTSVITTDVTAGINASQVNTNVADIETLLGTINTNVSDLETLLTTVNNNTTTINTNVADVENLITLINTTLSNIQGVLPQNPDQPTDYFPTRLTNGTHWLFNNSNESTSMVYRTGTITPSTTNSERMSPVSTTNTKFASILFVAKRTNSVNNTGLVRIGGDSTLCAFDVPSGTERVLSATNGYFIDLYNLYLQVSTLGDSLIYLGAQYV